MNIRPGDAAVQDVADHRDLQTFYAFLTVADREEIQKGLGRMFVETVAGVNDAASESPGQKLGRTGRWMANHKKVRLHRLDVSGGVEKRFALHNAACAGRDIDNIGGKPFGRQFK